MTEILNWTKNIILSTATVWNWLTTPLNFGFITVAPLYLFTGGALIGLAVYFIVRSLII